MPNRKAPSPALPGTRQEWIDVLKGLGILLVVFGHFIEQYRPANKLIATVFFCIYLFHMALFCMCSGLLAKFSLRKELTQTLWLYLAAQAVFVVFRALVLRENFAETGGLAAALFLPWRHMWYLYALLFWQLTLPALTALRDRFKAGGALLGFAVALAVGLAGGLVDWPFTLVRVFAFYPFYAFGVLFRPWLAELATQQRTPWLRPAAAGALGLALTLCLVGGLAGWYEPMQTARIFQDAPYGENYNAGNRFLFYLAGLLICVALVAVVNRGHLLAVLGRRTLPIYLLHLPLLSAFIETFGLYEPLRGGSAAAQVLFACALALGALALTGNRPVADAFGWFANLWYKKK